MASASGGRPGLNVVELGHDPATAYCSLLLSGLGADVAKVGAPGNVTPQTSAPPPPIEAAAALFLDEGKRVLDVPVDHRDVDALLGAADVILVGFPADVQHRFCVDSEALRARFPNAIVAVVGSGPVGSEGSVDDVGEFQAQAASGVMWLMGEPGRPPLRLPGTQAGYTAGLVLFTSIVFALHGRTRGARNRVVGTSRVRSFSYLDWKSQIYHESEGRVLTRGSESGPIVLRCTDGYLGFYYRPEDWPAVKELIGDARLDDEAFDSQAGRDHNRRELRAILERYTRSRPVAEVYRAAQGLGIPAGSVNTLDDVIAAYETSPGEVVRPPIPWSVHSGNEVESA